jgi:hypothetical protein
MQVDRHALKVEVGVVASDADLAEPRIENVERRGRAP